MKQAGGGTFDLLFDGNLGKPNVLVLTEHVNATYFISFDVPFRNMHDRGEINFAVVSQERVDRLGSAAWTVISQSFSPDLLFLTRCGLPSSLEVMQQAKVARVPAVYHIDDDLLDLPKSLGADIQKRNGSRKVKDARRSMLMGADLIYASTNVLAERMQDRFPGQRIFHGIYASYPGDFVPTVSHGGRPVVGYMGSKGHKEDLALVVPGLVALLERRPEVRFETFGTIEMPAELARFGDRVTAHPVRKSYADFLATLADLQWGGGLAPLVDSPFNACKAPTKFIEYACAGIPVIASDIPVYRDVISKSGGGVLVNDDWESSIEAVVASSEKGSAMVAAARGYCQSRFALELLEAQLHAVMAQVGMGVS